MKVKNSNPKFKVVVHHLPKRQFEKEFKEYGKKTQALAEEVNKKAAVSKIYIKKGQSPKQFKKVMQHEIGHAISDKDELHKKFSKSEKKVIREFAKEMYGKHRGKTSPQEDLREGLAWVYAKGKTGSPKEKKIIRKEYKNVYDKFKEAKKRLNMKVVKKTYGVVK